MIIKQSQKIKMMNVYNTTALIIFSHLSFQGLRELALGLQNSLYLVLQLHGNFIWAK